MWLELCVDVAGVVGGCGWLWVKLCVVVAGVVCGGVWSCGLLWITLITSEFE